MSTRAAVLLLTLPYALSLPYVNDTELTCDQGPGVLMKVVNPILKDLEDLFQSYKSCNQVTQEYALETQGTSGGTDAQTFYQSRKQAGKEGALEIKISGHDSPEYYGFGMLCMGGDMYYVFTANAEQALWDAFRGCRPDMSKVVLKCLIARGFPEDIPRNTPGCVGNVRDNFAPASSLNESPSEDDSSSEVGDDNDEAEDDEKDSKMNLLHNSRVTFVMIGVVPMMCLVGLIASRLRRNCQSNPLQRLHDEPETPQTGKATTLGSPSKSVNADEVVVEVDLHA